MKVSIMKKIYKILFTFFLVMGISSNAISSEDFFKKGLELFKDKKLMMQNLCLKEVLFSIQKTQTHIYI